MNIKFECKSLYDCIAGGLKGFPFNPFFPFAPVGTAKDCLLPIGEVQAV
jgi:hypothetical protein